MGFEIYNYNHSYIRAVGWQKLQNLFLSNVVALCYVGTFWELAYPLNKKMLYFYMLKKNMDKVLYH